MRMGEWAPDSGSGYVKKGCEMRDDSEAGCGDLGISSCRLWYCMHCRYLRPMLAADFWGKEPISQPFFLCAQ